MICGALVQFGCHVNECESLHLHAYQAKPESSCTSASTNCLYANHSKILVLKVATIPAKADVGMVVQKYEDNDSTLISLILVGSFGGTQYSLLLWLISKLQKSTLILWV